MADELYYKHGGQHYGPVTGAELKELAAAGNLLPDDLIWKEGMEKWVPARSAKGLFPPAPAPTPAAVTRRGQTNDNVPGDDAQAGRVVPHARTAKSADSAGERPPVRRAESLPLPDEDDDGQPPRPARASKAGPSAVQWSTNLLDKGKGIWRQSSLRTKIGIGGGAGAIVVLLILVPVLLLSGGKSSTMGGSNEPEGAATRPGRPDSPHPRFAEEAKQADALFASVDYSKGPNGEVLEPKELTEGEVKIKAQGFRQGTKFITHGLVTVWYANGQKKSETYWFNDKKHGSVLAWHPNGQKSWKGYHKNGKREGHQVYWHEDGAKDFEGAYKNGTNEGAVIKYYRNGNVMRETEYENHQFNGVRAKSEKWHDDQGNPANGPTIRALTKLDFVKVLEYRANEHSVLPRADTVSGKVFPPNPPAENKYRVLVNMDFDYYMRFIGLPESGFNPDFVKQADQDWTYTCLDGPLRIRVSCGRPIAGKEGIILGKAERVIIDNLIQ